MELVYLCTEWTVVYSTIVLIAFFGCKPSQKVPEAVEPCELGPTQVVGLGCYSLAFTVLR